MSSENGSKFSTERVLTAACPHCKGRLSFNLTEIFSDAPFGLRADGTSGRIELSLVCITQGHERVIPFIKRMRDNAASLRAEFLLALDMNKESFDYGLFSRFRDIAPTIMIVESKGYVESVLETVLKSAKGNWILRLDDDEAMSPGLLQWLRNRDFYEHDRWRIPTAALWPDESHFITMPPLWPDAHLRLTTWEYTSWRDEIHAGTEPVHNIAPASILHYKYLLKPYEERVEVAKKYDSIKDGAGTGIHMPFTLPEDWFDEISVFPLGTGYFPNYSDLVGEGKRIQMRRE